MNEKITKKVGEACAFAAVLCKTYEENKIVMDQLLGDTANDLIMVTNAQMKQLQAICDEVGTTEILRPKVVKTGEKITRMGEMYVGDDWDDAAEVLEWMSFFVGGAIVHWQLIAGAGAAMDDEQLTDAATSGVAYYDSLMDQLKRAATTIGTERAH